MIRIKDYPQLKLISWNRHTDFIDDDEALALYESNWRFIDQNNLADDELKLINHLTVEYGHGVLNV